jgi:hypothetical protein
VKTLDINFIVAVVTQIINGKHGRYAVSRQQPGQISSIPLSEYITFSLDDDVWKEDTDPDPGTLVYLSKLQCKIQGWRATKARFLAPSDRVINDPPKLRNGGFG